MAATLKSELKKWFKHWYLGSRAVQFLTPEAVEEEKAYYKYFKQLIDNYVDSFDPVLEVKKKKSK